MKNRRKKGNREHSFACGQYLLDYTCGLYKEEYFRDLLARERKRTERSHKPFLLALIDIGDLIGNNEKTDVPEKVADSLQSSTRETDIRGWYLSGAVIGVILTETLETNAPFIMDKIKHSLNEVLGTEEMMRIKVTCRSFPEQQKGDGGDDDRSLFYPDLAPRRPSQKATRILKRIMDITGSIFCIILFAPFFIAIAILIKATSKGPVFFKQERIGQFGKRFTFLKFRSMYIDCDDQIHKDYIRDLICENKSAEGGNEMGKKEDVYKIKDDPRITWVGSFIRKSSLDELPQFFNVLRGDMSLVGPRPPIPYELDHYTVWHKRRINEVKPGITGIWQIRGRSSTTFDEMVRMDIQYVREWSLFMDVKILLMTPAAMFNGRGAY